jgi:tetratricopeptide (TPR) repeat protein
MVKKQDKTEGGIVAVEEALSKTERFIENNQKLLTIIIGSIVIVVLVFFAFKRFYLAPKEQEVKEQMFTAEKYFEIDSLQLALNGDGMYPGFLKIIDDYGMTQGANLAEYYAGICYLKLGNYNEAIDHLKSFKGKDHILGPMSRGAIGDAYMELNQPGKAADYYQEAAGMKENEFTTPIFLMKAGMTYEIQKDYKKALEVYEKIKFKFPNTTEGRDVDKYIARVKGLM